MLKSTNEQTTLVLCLNRRHIFSLGCECVAIGNPERHMRKASHRGSKQQ